MTSLTRPRRSWRGALHRRASSCALALLAALALAQCSRGPKEPLPVVKVAEAVKGPPVKLPISERDRVLADSLRRLAALKAQAVAAEEAKALAASASELPPPREPVPSLQSRRSPPLPEISGAPPSVPALASPGSASSAQAPLTARVGEYRLALGKARDLARSGKLESAAGELESARRRHREDRDLVRAVAEAYGLLGTELLERGDTDGARRFARLGLDADSDAAAPRVVRGELAYAANDLNDALREWEKGLRLNPEHVGLRARVEKAKRELAVLGRFNTHSSAHFVVTFEGREDREAAAFALSALEEAYVKVGEFLAHQPQERIAVVLYPERAFESVEGKPTWAGAIYDGKLRVPTGGALSRQRDFRATLAHEYAHALFHRITQGNRAPSWLNEGLAEVAEGLLEPTPQISCGWGHGMALQHLEGGFSHLRGPAVGHAYLSARHATEQLLAKHGVANVRELLRLIGKRVAFDAAFEQALSRNYAGFARAFDAEPPAH